MKWEGNEPQREREREKDERRASTEPDDQCQRCGAWGWKLYEFTSPTTGLCGACSARRQTGDVACFFCGGYSPEMVEGLSGRWYCAHHKPIDEHDTRLALPPHLRPYPGCKTCAARGAKGACDRHRGWSGEPAAAEAPEPQVRSRQNWDLERMGELLRAAEHVVTRKRTLSPDVAEELAELLTRYAKGMR